MGGVCLTCDVCGVVGDERGDWVVDGVGWACELCGVVGNIGWAKRDVVGVW